MKICTASPGLTADDRHKGAGIWTESTKISAAVHKSLIIIA
jgi:hypothetical protein